MSGPQPGQPPPLHRQTAGPPGCSAPGESRLPRAPHPSATQTPGEVASSGGEPILGHRCPCWFTRYTEVLPLCHLGLGRGSGKGLSVYPGPPVCCPGITPIINAVDIVLIFSTFQMEKLRHREGNAPHTAWSTCGHKLYPLHKPTGALTRPPVHIRPLSPQHTASVGMKINRG